MARELVVVWAGRQQRNAWEELCGEYRRRIAGFLPVRDVPVRSRTAVPGAERLRVEAAALRGALPDPVYLVALDRRGTALSSEDLASRLGRIRDQWPHAVGFVIGSDLGLDPSLLGAARLRLSLGPLTLPHELARLVLYEQLYRALSLLAGMPYHRRPL